MMAVRERNFDRLLAELKRASTDSGLPDILSGIQQQHQQWQRQVDAAAAGDEAKALEGAVEQLIESSEQDPGELSGEPQLGSTKCSSIYYCVLCAG